jgi:hypothetical protein
VRVAADSVSSHAAACDFDAAGQRRQVSLHHRQVCERPDERHTVLYADDHGRLSFGDANYRAALTASLVGLPEDFEAMPRRCSRSSMAELAFVMALLVVRFECRCADCFAFGAVRCCRAVCSHVAIGAIEVGEFGREFVTHCKSVGWKIPAGV